jgi:tryptophan synthase alpha chain
VIHAAATRALASGATLPGVLEMARALAERVPVVAMCYANPILARGVERFANELAERGVAGLIVPDMPLEEAAGVRAACDAAGVALVPLVAPTTPDDRMDAIGAAARGFVYVVSVTGTTGERAALAEGVADVVARTRARTTVPVAVGFGIATPEQALAAADAGADGVIVGTRLVRAATESENPAGAVREVVEALSAALGR